MAEKRTLATLSGPIGKFELAAAKFVFGTDFYPEQAAAFIHGLKRLQPFDQDNPYSELMQRALSLATELDIKVDGLSGKGADGDPDEFKKYIGDLSRRLDELRSKRQKAAKTIEEDQQVIEVLGHIQDVDENMENFFRMETVEFRFGRIKLPIYNKMKDRIEARMDALFIPTSIEEEYVYGMYFALPSSKELADAFFTALRFERIFLPGSIHGTPAQAAESFKRELETKMAEAQRLEKELADMTEHERQSFIDHYRYGILMNDIYNLRTYASHTEERFYIVGYVLLNGAEDFARSVEQEPGFSCVLA